jgi:hypothetical protein
VTKVTPEKLVQRVRNRQKTQKPDFIKKKSLSGDNGDKGDKGDRGFTTTINSDGQFPTGIIEGPPGMFHHRNFLSLFFLL